MNSCVSHFTYGLNLTIALYCFCYVRWSVEILYLNDSNRRQSMSRVSKMANSLVSYMPTDTVTNQPHSMLTS